SATSGPSNVPLEKQSIGRYRETFARLSPVLSFLRIRSMTPSVYIRRCQCWRDVTPSPRGPHVSPAPARVPPPCIDGPERFPREPPPLATQVARGSPYPVSGPHTLPPWLRAEASLVLQWPEKTMAWARGIL